jgi:putative membrane protein
MIGPVLAAAALAGWAVATAGPAGWWVVVAIAAACCALLAFDRSRSLGHRVDGEWLVAQAGTLHRRRDCIAAPGIIGWTVRQTYFQRRAGVATLIAATAAGVKRYQVLDVPADWAWSVAATATPWVGETAWARGSDLR